MTYNLDTPDEANNANNTDYGTRLFAFETAHRAFELVLAAIAADLPPGTTTSYASLFDALTTSYEAAMHAAAATGAGAEEFIGIAGAYNTWAATVDEHMQADVARHRIMPGTPSKN